MILILDYGMGNLKSLSNALKKKDIQFKIISSPKNESFSHIILPGVGSYPRAINELKKRNLIDFLKYHNSKNVPILGICLGMQILSSVGFEKEETVGLNLIEGEVRNIKILKPEYDCHVGWNSINLKKNNKLFDNINLDCEFYFDHSYFFKTFDNDEVLSETFFTEKFSSGIIKKNLIGLQFHPEKSHDNGIKILENFYYKFNA